MIGAVMDEFDEYKGEEGYKNTFNEYLKGTKTEITAEDLEGVTKIEKYSFSYSPITSIDIPQSVVVIDERAFYYCTKLKSVTVPDSVTTLGNGAFERASSLETLVLGNGITHIPNNLCGYVPLKQLTIGNSVVSFGTTAFVNTKLTSVVLPSTVTTMGVHVFWNGDFKEIICLAENPPTIQATTFEGSYLKTCIFKVPAGSVEAYKTATNWSAFADNIIALTDEEVLQYGNNEN